jgi:hypothetical protein
MTLAQRSKQSGVFQAFLGNACSDRGKYSDVKDLWRLNELSAILIPVSRNPMMLVTLKSSI